MESKIKKRVSVVCVANFCRSPVAENLLKHFHKDIEVISAGIQPLNEYDMDKRSRNYLDKLGVQSDIHVPKRITKIMIDTSDIILAMDHQVLFELNKAFSNSKDKIKIFTHQHSNQLIADPYRFTLDRYNSVMEKINYICQEIIF